MIADNETMGLKLCAGIRPLLSLAPTMVERERAISEFHETQALAFILLGESMPAEKPRSGRYTWHQNKHRR